MNTRSRRAAAFPFGCAVFWCSFKFWCDLTSLCAFMVCICHVCYVFFKKFLPHLSWIYSPNFFPTGFKLLKFSHLSSQLSWSWFLCIVCGRDLIFHFWFLFPPHFGSLLSWSNLLRSPFPPHCGANLPLCPIVNGHIYRGSICGLFSSCSYSVCVSLYSCRIMLITIAM